MPIDSLSDLFQHIGLAAKPPARVQVVETARLNEWIRQAWNFGKAAGEREVRRELHQLQAKQAAEGDEELQLKVRLAALQNAKRSKRD